MVIGTAGLAAHYGISDQKLPNSRGEARSLLESAHRCGIRRIDTAATYTLSEDIIGGLPELKWKITTKLPPMDERGLRSPRSWVRHELGKALQRLARSSVDTLLLHRPSDLLGPQGHELYSALVECREGGYCKRIGVSLYDVAEIPVYFDSFALNAIQIPFNVLDTRLVTEGYAVNLRASGVQIQARSVFLQGLLLMPTGSQIERFPGEARAWRSLEYWYRTAAVSPLSACLNFVLNQSEIDLVVCGAQTPGQLDELLTAAACERRTDPPSGLINDPRVLDPRTWT